MTRSRRPLLNLSLSWKLLLPFLVLMLIAGMVGGFLVVRSLSSRAEAALEQDLARIALEADSAVRDGELYLLETVNIAANLRGVSAAVARRDSDEAGRLLRSVSAIKTDLAVLVALDRRGAELQSYFGTSRHPSNARPPPWGDLEFVRDALASRQGVKTSGFVRLGGRSVMAIAAPVCPPVGRRCSPVGAVVAGVALNQVVAQLAGDGQRDEAAPARGVALFSPSGELLTASGLTAPRPPPEAASAEPIRTITGDGSEAVATLYGPLEIQGRPAGTLAVSIPAAPAFASAREAGFGLGWILVAATAGALLIGAALSRLILRQVRPLIETNRALGSGDLSARTPVLSEDELGELARGVNAMAEQLQASHENLESRVAERTAEVERLLRERTEFFAGLSHELQTPLAVVLTKADLMMNRDFRKTQAWSVQTGAILRSSATQLLELVNDILQLAKAETGALDVTLKPERLSDVVEELRGSIEGLAEEGGLRSRIEVPAELPHVTADRARLKDILQNLVSNAVKYTPAGGEVSLSASAHNGVVEVSVSDTGVGIPKSEGKRIFEPFYRVKGTRAQKGQPSNGLGLALTKRLVEAHGGDIDFRSRKGGSTTFTFTIPVAAGSKESE